MGRRKSPFWPDVSKPNAAECWTKHRALQYVYRSSYDITDLLRFTMSPPLSVLLPSVSYHDASDNGSHQLVGLPPNREDTDCVPCFGSSLGEPGNEVDRFTGHGERVD